MATLQQIRQELKATIKAAVATLNVYDHVPETVRLPAACIVPRTTNFAIAFGRGSDTYMFDVLVLTSRRDDQLAQHDLDDYVNGAGSKSIRQAIWNNRTLGLDDGTEAFVVGMADYGARFDVGEIDHVGARLQVQVGTPGTA